MSHYWDCRLKGRPPGTKKSTDPDKKKRKRVARERDLCDVKIKITEYFDQREYEEQLGHRPPGVQQTDSTNPMLLTPNTVANTGIPSNQQFFGQAQVLGQQQPVNAWNMAPNISQSALQMPFQPTLPIASASSSKKFYTVQRVNGNGGNGKGDGVAGPHKHSLEESDRVKKNSVLRWQAKCEKDDRKKSLVGETFHSRTKSLFFLVSLALCSCMQLICTLRFSARGIRHVDACFGS